MVNRGASKLQISQKQKWIASLRFSLHLASIFCATITLAIWLMPLDILQSWALERAGGDEYRQLEAVGRTEFSCWLIRFVAPIVGVAAYRLKQSSARTADLIANLFSGFFSVTRIDGNLCHSFSWRTWSLRAILAVWGIAAVGHSVHAFQDCMTNWSYFRLRGGSQILPNISDSNVEVIRYLLQVTEPDSRIFVVSDQKLFFLSYYLLPRRLFYKAHPDSEFVIPRPFQQRRMEAYQFSEIDPQTIDRIRPDYILEYFEHPDFVDRTRVNDDSVWVSFYRSFHADPVAEPKYLVCLRRVKREPVSD